MPARPRFSTLLTRWVMGMVMACVVLAWPLHEARHVAETMQGAAQVEWLASVIGADDANGSDGSDGSDDGAGQVAKPCLWCMFHGEHYLGSGSPPSLVFHAEASPPPVAALCGRPTGRCPLAAEPRGPPRA